LFTLWFGCSQPRLCFGGWAGRPLGSSRWVSAVRASRPGWVGPGFLASPIRVPSIQLWLPFLSAASWAGGHAVLLVRAACRHTPCDGSWLVSSGTAGGSGLTACRRTPCHGLAGTPGVPPQVGRGVLGWLPAGHRGRGSLAPDRPSLPGVPMG